MKNKRRFLFSVIVLLACSCSSEPQREILITDFPHVDGGKLHPAEVFYENTDTIGLKNIQALVRFRNISPHYDRFNFVIETFTPDSLTWRDTLSVEYRQQELTETTSLTYTDIKTDYRSNTRFTQTGRYRFRFGAVMPDSFDEEVIGLGLEITTH